MSPVLAKFSANYSANYPQYEVLIDNELATQKGVTSGVPQRAANHRGVALSPN